MQTYFGVDANDEEAVKQRQEELARENFKKLFGEDADVDDIDFSGSSDTEHKKHIHDIHDIHESLQKALKWILDKISPKKSSRNK